MRYILLIYLFLYTINCSAQARIKNLHLKHELDSIGAQDELYRAQITNMTAKEAESLSISLHIPLEKVRPYIEDKQKNIDAWTIKRIEAIIAQYGYPGKDLVDTPTNTVAFMVIQHSQKIDKYLPLLQKAAARKELSYTLVAMMEDRQLTNKGKEQLYGTQLWGEPVKDSSGHVKIEWYFFPIKDPMQLNKRRAKVGFTETMEQYAAGFGIPFRVKKRVL